MKKSKLDELFEKIAKRHLFIDTLIPQNRDRFDFHSCSVRSISAALEEAFKAGVQVGAAVLTK